MITSFFGNITKGMLVALIAIAVLIGSNIATLLSSSYHDAAFSLLDTVLPDSLTYRSPTHRLERQKHYTKKNAQYEKVKSKAAIEKTRLNGIYAARAESKAMSAQLAESSAELAATKQKLHQTNTKLTSARAKTQTVSSKIAKRVARNVAVNVSSIPAESVPVLGVGMVIAVTAMDIRDSCETLKDINSLFENEAKLAEEGVICGVQIGSVEDQLKSSQESAKDPHSWFSRAIESISPDLNAPKPAPIEIAQHSFANNDALSSQMVIGGTINEIKQTYQSKANTIKDAIGGTLFEIFN